MRGFIEDKVQLNEEYCNYKLVYFIILQAMKDLDIDLDWIPDNRSDKLRWTEMRKDRDDARDFFKTNRLERFIESYFLDLDPSWTRRVLDGLL